MNSYDIIIIGSGVAGLSAALVAAQRARTLLITKDALEESNTRYAQGGIAAALGADDSAAAHLQDTVAAGAGLVDERAAAILTAGGRAAIEELVRLGVPFDRTEGTIALGREAAHSAFRIVHAGGDATGAQLEQTLAARVRAAGVDLREQALVTRLCIDDGRISGVEVLDCVSGSRSFIESTAVILATGGAGRLYSHTTNPPIATGDGIALAYRAGAEVMDMEFIQFHPTALRLEGAPTFLISEAVRGEGALLRDRDGRAFMSDYDPRAELASRDVVARAIQSQMARTEAESAFLDLSHLPAERVHSRFPQIDNFCRSHGLDITRDWIPVAPAAHYTMGGVRTNAWGETNVPGLYACGEVACTGVHGANRLASNSLLEGLVFAHRAVERALTGRADSGGQGERLRIGPPPSGPREAAPLTLAALQRLMWERAGIVRTGEGLEQARTTLAAVAAGNRQPATGESVSAARSRLLVTTRAEHELANLTLVGNLVIEAAWQRRESRGAHYRSDYPEPSAAWRRHLVFRREEAAGEGNAAAHIQTERQAPAEVLLEPVRA